MNVGAVNHSKSQKKNKPPKPRKIERAKRPRNAYKASSRAKKEETAKVVEKPKAKADKPVKPASDKK